MGELRWNPLAARWVVVAGHRELRPVEQDRSQEIARPSRSQWEASCPFCPGNEAETLPPVDAIEEDRGWTMRVVPNKFPSFAGTGVLDPSATIAEASGASEVVIFTERHDLDLVDMHPDAVARLLDLLRRRVVEHGQRPEIRHSTVIVNCGPASGASIVHGHAQILSTPFVPPTVEVELDGFTDVPDLAASAFGSDESLVVARRPSAIAGCPTWAGLPYETWIVPTSSEADWATSTDDAFEDVAELLVDLLDRQRRVLGAVDYNVVIRLPPFGVAANFRWYVTILPRHVSLAGFELASGVAVNAVPAEVAAERLRTA